MTFGMKEPSSLEALLSPDRPVTLEQLLIFGRNLTVDQFLETKNEFDQELQSDELEEAYFKYDKANVACAICICQLHGCEIIETRKRGNAYTGGQVQ